MTRNRVVGDYPNNPLATDREDAAGVGRRYGNNPMKRYVVMILGALFLLIWAAPGFAESKNSKGPNQVGIDVIDSFFGLGLQYHREISSRLDWRVRGYILEHKNFDREGKGQKYRVRSMSLNGGLRWRAIGPHRSNCYLFGELGLDSQYGKSEVDEIEIVHVYPKVGVGFQWQRANGFFVGIESGRAIGAVDSLEMSSGGDVGRFGAHGIYGLVLGGRF